MYLKIHARLDMLVAGPKFSGHSFVKIMNVHDKP